ncbi:FAD/NAD(P)-binding domain-containing protein [Penicillium verhagenii]|nr:FAD/NAD(P)-binding domain-containing protein [Penicillium verhagenii]
MSPPKTFTTTIIGGGIGGLTLAIGLLRRGVPVQIYEAASSFQEIGLGLSIGPAAHRALPLLDPQIRQIYDALVTTHADSPGYASFRDTWFEIVWACGPHEGDLLMDLKAQPSGQTTVRRSDFLAALVSLVPAEIVHFGKRLERVEENSGPGADGTTGDTGRSRKVGLVFDDGTHVCADVVIGCDGIKSKVKESVFPASGHAVYSGMYGYRAVLEMEDMVRAVGEKRARVSTLYLGDGVYGISYPIMRAKKVNVGLYVLQESWDCETWVRGAEREDMRRDARGMGRYWGELVEHMPDPSQWAIFEHPPLERFWQSRVAILGDAAHASTPHQGAGAGQAIEDAHVLAELLGDERVISADDVEAAFRAYDEIRRPRSQRVVTSSKENAYLLCLCLEGVGNDEVKLRNSFQERMKWLWDLDVQDQVEQAREKMISYLG